MKTLYDNHFGDNGDWVSELSNTEVAALRRYSGKTLRELKNLAGSNLIVIGEGAGSDDEDSISYFSIGAEKEEDGETSVVKQLRLDTGNLMGVLNLRDRSSTVRVAIHSRFDEGNKKQPFLNYLLSRVYDINYLDLVQADNQSFMEILLAIRFVQRIAEAREVGLYRQYKEFRCNDLNFKGRLDLSRHIRENMPVGGRIAYVKREITFDTPLNHLFRFVVALIEKRWPMLLERNIEAKRMISELKVNSPSWSSMSLVKTLQERECRESVRHPFFAQYYEELRVLARMLLCEDGLNVFEADESEVSGVIFDGAWLWESYLATVLEPLGYTHAICGTDVGRLSIFEEVPNDWGRAQTCFYPDFYNSTRGVVLDAKYKRGMTCREDIMQLLAYALNTGAGKVGLIYPPNESSAVCSGVVHQNMRDAELLWESFTFGGLPFDRDDLTKVQLCMETQEQVLRECLNVR